ncbi:potassium-transporting ATPase subunit C [Francisella tularensis]|uniref:Potassium-transporting ATPase KdpC subunit n=6 Tax=Francisella tularensis TaxID=263 RepID=A0AAI8FUI3_FRATH|nr:potassium-transporting ATPase subunit C [Francisella tularensis]AFX71486.1 potassium-transporting ATPase C chain [Francisella tularensis subsp. holarctica F92]EBA53262.1 potassium-transporting ATPase, C chain [Francisella tularensis subsp. holarctica 257]ABI83563.1 potassium-transporting ATPase [Francisella tularensis subsp. holarctica OSU18]ABU62464.1 potassium-transporting ATPase C chain [Francisella tularensis subsp. holarctica FTNF002-00]AFT93434.1 potassium-transporting ATPase C chain 
MKNLLKSFIAMLFFTVLLGLIYPFFVMALGYSFANNQAKGSQTYYDGKLVGSELIGQNMPANLFQTRLSASAYNPLATGGTNYAVNNQKQLQDVQQRVKELQAKYGNKSIPADLVFASASGVDPDITLQSALYQAAYVAKQNNFSLEQVTKLIQANTKRHVFNVDTVNVLNLNIGIMELINKGK